MRFGVLLETPELMVIDKPSGLVVHRGFSGAEEDLLGWLEARGYGRVFPVHRLDRATSGVLVVARTVEAARELNARFSAREVDKTYWAFVRGAFPMDTIEVDHPVPRDEGGERIAATSIMRGLQTVEVADSPLMERRYAWVEARPLTGRFHQVRRHTKHLGHPVLGDTTYGRTEHNRLLRERFGLTRLALHARRLSVRGFFDVEAPLPADLAEPMERLGFAIDSVDELGERRDFDRS